MEEQLVSFGNFLLKNYGVTFYDSRGFAAGIRQISDADLRNWEHENNEFRNSLPSQHQHGDQVEVWFQGKPQEDVPAMTAKIRGVHFYGSKVKYDLEIPVYDEESTRIYNIDSCFVFKHN